MGYYKCAHASPQWNISVINQPPLIKLLDIGRAMDLINLLETSIYILQYYSNLLKNHTIYHSKPRISDPHFYPVPHCRQFLAQKGCTK